ncbi:MAG: hypothetical protein J6D52_11500, partial [Clostridia bacterium]|nr:hypothetical protein [Clostridia bacterium]
NLTNTGDEDTSFQEISSRIISAKEKLISKSGKTGSFVKGTLELNTLNEKLTDAENAAKQKQQLNAEIDKLKANAAILIKESETLKKILDSKEDIKNAQKLKDYLNIKSKLDELNCLLTTSDGTIIDEMFIKKVDFCLKKMESHREKISTLNDEINKIEDKLRLASSENVAQTKTELQEITDKIKIIENQKSDLDKRVLILNDEIEKAKEAKEAAKNSRKSFNSVLLLLALMLFAIGGTFIFALSTKIAGISVFVLSAVVFIISFKIKPKNKSLLLKAETVLADLINQEVDLKNENVLKGEEINNLSERINLLTAALNTDAAIKAGYEIELENKKNQLTDETQKLNLAKLDLDKIYSKLSPENPSNTLSDLQNIIEEQKLLKLKLNFLSSDLGNISYEEAQKKLYQIENTTPITDTDFDDSRLRFEQITQELSTIKTDITKRDTELKTAYRNFQNPEEIKKEINLLEESLNSQKEFCDAATIAVEILQQSSNEMRRSYGATLEKKATEFFSRLTKNKYSTFLVSKEMDISVEETKVFGKRQIGYLSRGAADQAYLSLRLAVSQLISKDEAIPVFLDDVLSQYDDSRTFAALEFLNEYSHDSQAILFTCHNHICQMAQQLAIPWKNLHT